MSIIFFSISNFLFEEYFMEAIVYYAF
jgi:hypothetical protein